MDAISFARQLRKRGYLDLGGGMYSCVLGKTGRATDLVSLLAA